ncbi:hypothetical protein PF003_g32826 [Phytophthora fragariae]|nr:hypothetical protein PF003_g32826 [Phytophthora fragariae]
MASLSFGVRHTSARDSGGLRSSRAVAEPKTLIPRRRHFRVTNAMSPVKTCVVLTSSMVSITEQKYAVQHLKQLLDGNRITYTEVDCSLEENRDTRDRYFQASGIRANYPQVFLQDPEGKDIQYIGSFKEIQEFNEMNDLPVEILKANNIPTLNSVFADVSRRA